MAQEIYGLTLADVQFLKQLRRDNQNTRQNAPSARLGNDIYDEPPQAPEVYIALVPSGGIPACTPGVGTGGPDFTQGDVPGVAECQIYRIISGALYSIDKSHRVYNLSATAVDQQWVMVSRDKFGNWIAQTGSPPCEAQSEQWQIHMLGDPDSGSFSIQFEVDPFGSGDTITIDWDSSDSEAQTAFEGHSEVGSGNVEVTGGPLPETNLTVTFKGDLAETPIGLPTVNRSGLVSLGTGSGATEAFGVIITIPRPGFAGGSA